MTIPRITRFYYEEQPSMPPLEVIHTSGAYAKEKELQRKKIKYTRVDLYANNVVLEEVLQENQTIPGSKVRNVWTNI